MTVKLHNKQNIFSEIKHAFNFKQTTKLKVYQYSKNKTVQIVNWLIDKRKVVVSFLGLTYFPISAFHNMQESNPILILIAYLFVIRAIYLVINKSWDKQQVAQEIGWTFFHLFYRHMILNKNEKAPDFTSKFEQIKLYELEKIAEKFFQKTNTRMSVTFDETIQHQNENQGQVEENYRQEYKKIKFNKFEKWVFLRYKDNLFDMIARIIRHATVIIIHSIFATPMFFTIILYIFLSIGISICGLPITLILIIYLCSLLCESFSNILQWLDFRKHQVDDLIYSVFNLDEHTTDNIHLIKSIIFSHKKLKNSQIKIKSGNLNLFYQHYIDFSKEIVHNKDYHFNAEEQHTKWLLTFIEEHIHNKNKKEITEAMALEDKVNHHLNMIISKAESYAENGI